MEEERLLKIMDDTLWLVSQVQPNVI